MDFLARAGSAMERSHRLAGILFAAVVIQILLIGYFIKTNADLKQEYYRLRQELKVYVVPGSLAGIYQPTQPDILVTEFSSFIVQSLNTFTFANYERQYNEAREYFVPALRRLTDNRYYRQIEQARNDERSSMFIEDRNSKRVEVIGDPRDLENLQYRVTLQGVTQYILGGAVVEVVPIEVTMTLLPTFINKTNPFGFMVKEYQEQERKVERRTL